MDALYRRVHSNKLYKVFLSWSWKYWIFLTPDHALSTFLQAFHDHKIPMNTSFTDCNEIIFQACLQKLKAKPLLTKLHIKKMQNVENIFFHIQFYEYWWFGQNTKILITLQPTILYQFRGGGVIIILCRKVSVNLSL